MSCASSWLARAPTSASTSRPWRSCRPRSWIRPAPGRRPPGCSTATPKRCLRLAATKTLCNGSSTPRPLMPRASPTPKSGSRSSPDVSTLAQDHDCLLLDLDGTVFRGNEPTPGAVDTLAAVRSRTLFVTNNASRGPAEVAQHLCAMGFTANLDDIVTSAQTAARLLQEQLQPGAAVLIIGTDSLAAEVRKAGHKPVRQLSDVTV